MSEISPLTPPDCDLRDFQFMPLDVVRLRDSDIAVMVSGEEFRSAVMLWCASWHQVPAGSLPNDDRSLASLAGYGRAVGEWLKVKDGALRGWIECSDGRLYHAVVCEKARESWDSKLQHAYDKLVDRLRKMNKRREESGQPSVVCPPFDIWKSTGRPMESQLLSAGNEPAFQRKEGGVPADGPRNDSGRDADAGGELGAPVEGDAAQDALSGNSAGTEDVSAGNVDDFQRKGDEIPLENRLKGQVREGTGKGEVKKKSGGVGSSNVVGPVDNSESPPPLSADEIGEALQRLEAERGKTVALTPRAREALLRIAERRIAMPVLLRAHALARARRDADRDSSAVNPGFLEPFVDEALSEGRGAPPGADWDATTDGVQAKAGEHGLRQGADEPWLWFRLRVIQASGDQRLIEREVSKAERMNPNEFERVHVLMYGVAPGQVAAA